MFKKQVTALTAILKDKDIREYSGDAFWNIIKAVVLGDVGALLDVTNDLKDILFHTPTVLFWDKMQRYLFGTFRDYSDQVKMSAKFTNDNSDYEAFVKKQIHLINEMNDDKKIAKCRYGQGSRYMAGRQSEGALLYSPTVLEKQF